MVGLDHGANPTTSKFTTMYNASVVCTYVHTKPELFQSRGNYFSQATREVVNFYRAGFVTRRIISWFTLCPFCVFFQPGTDVMFF
jgi:hypothetical protein